jgi:hypothetical protein
VTKVTATRIAAFELFSFLKACLISLKNWLKSIEFLSKSHKNLHYRPISQKSSTYFFLNLLMLVNFGTFDLRNHREIVRNTNPLPKSLKQQKIPLQKYIEPK